MNTRNTQKTRFPRFAVAATLALAGGLMLAGCGVENIPAPGSSLGKLAITGSVHGGQQPIIGSRVYLFATNNTGYGTAAKSMLTSNANTQSDGTNYYVATNASGDFSITSDYSTANCPSATSQAYLLALSGNPGSGSNNTSIALMAPLSLCSSLSAGLIVNIDEVSTVASVYALHQFLDATGHNIGTTSANTTGLANAFATIGNIISVQYGTALSSTANTYSNGTVPLANINAIANLLSTCVNNASQCSAIFAAATPGTPPTDTLGLALTLANNPTYNVSNTYSLITTSPPFNPSASPAPSDWGLEVIYAGNSAVPINAARYLDIDSTGNIYIANAATTGGFISQFSNTGTPLLKASAIGGTTTTLQGIAITPAGHIYAGSNGSSSGPGYLYDFGASFGGPGGPIALTTCQPWQIASDSNGNIIMGSSTSAGTNPGLCSYTPSTSSNSFLGLGYPGDALYGISIGTHNQAWAAMGTSSGNTPGTTTQGILDAVDSAGTLTADTGNNTSGFTQSGQGGLSYSVAAGNGYAWVVGQAGSGQIYANAYNANTGSANGSFTFNLSGATTASVARDAILDGNANLWFTTNSGQLYTANKTSLATYSLQNSSITNLWGLGIDTSGNVWAAVPGTTGSLVQYLGVAAPVQTPRAANIVP